MIDKNIQKLIKGNLGIKLDIGCGSNKQHGYIGMDIRAVDGVDIVHDAEKVPYPLPSNCCSTILVSHLVEHICPKIFLSIIDEWWRIMKVQGQLLVAMPYATSYGFYQDPTHCHHMNETSWYYFTPSHPLYQIYHPKPWNIVRNAWWENGNMEVILEKIEEVKSEKR